MAFKFTFDVNGGSGENLVFGDGYLSLDGIMTGFYDGQLDGSGNVVPSTAYATIDIKALYDTYSYLYPTRDGYRLIGWSKDPNSTTINLPLDIDFEVYIFNDTVYYAVWEEFKFNDFHFNILLPDGTPSREAGSVGIQYTPAPYNACDRVYNDHTESLRSGPYETLYISYFEPGDGLKLDQVTSTGNIYYDDSIDYPGWIINIDKEISKIEITFTTKYVLPQDVYISPQGDIYAKSFKKLEELIEKDGVPRSEIYISPEGDIYASEYINGNSFKIINDRIHGKSFNIGKPY